MTSRVPIQESGSPVFKVERGCPNAPMGCGCTGACRELIEVVPASEYFRLLGRVEQMERDRCS